MIKRPLLRTINAQAMTRYAIPLLILALALASPFGVNQHALSADQIPIERSDHIENSNSADRGKQLRKALEERLQELASKKTLKPQNNITDLFVDYIPDGSSLDDAKSILFASGFDIRTLDNQISGSTKLPSAWFAAVEVNVRISSNKKARLNSDVETIDAVMTYTTL